MTYGTYPPLTGPITAAQKTELKAQLDTLNKVIGGSASGWYDKNNPRDPATGSMVPDGGSAALGGATDGEVIPQQLNKQMQDEIVGIQAVIDQTAET